MPRYTLLPGKTHYHGEKTLKGGDTVELSEKAYLVHKDKFVPEGTNLSANDVQSLQARLQQAEAEIARRDAEDAAKARAAKDQSVTKPPVVAQGTPPAVTVAKV
jgi:hypothetical protein